MLYMTFISLGFMALSFPAGLDAGEQDFDVPIAYVAMLSLYVQPQVGCRSVQAPQLAISTHLARNPSGQQQLRACCLAGLGASSCVCH